MRRKIKYFKRFIYFINLDRFTRQKKIKKEKKTKNYGKKSSALNRSAILSLFFILYKEIKQHNKN
mgnify:CR=1 FL=1